jgi:hypothetical protein
MGRAASAVAPVSAANDKPPIIVPQTMAAAMLRRSSNNRGIIRKVPTPSLPSRMIPLSCLYIMTPILIKLNLKCFPIETAI